jgi:dipeptidyl aminopeptidase/acylaminoacyl peptidase
MHHRLLLEFALPALAWMPLASATPANAPSHLFEGRDLFGLQWATEPQIRPDGGTIAYVRMSYDILSDRARSAIWLIEVNTGAQTPLTSGPGSQSALAWSPDGKRLAFVSNVPSAANPGEVRAELLVRWLATGQTARVADLAFAPESLAWSPDGRFIAFTDFTPDDKATLGAAPAKPEGATWAAPLGIITDVTYRADGAGYLKPGYTHAFVVSAEGGAPRQLSFGAFNEAGPISWSADGRFLYMSGNRTENWRLEPLHSEIYRVALADGALSALTNGTGPKNAPIVSPDGSHIAYLGFADQLLSYQDLHLYVMDRDGRNLRPISDGLDRSIAKAIWASDGRSLYIEYTDRAVTKIARLSLDGHIEPIAQGLSGGEFDRPYTGGSFSLAANGAVVFTSGTAERPSDLSVAYRGRVKRLTSLNEELFADKSLGKVEPLAVQSSFDHRSIDAWLVTPPKFDAHNKYPLILEIHGGPFAAYGPIFSTDDQLYTAAGYAVLYANPRGSTSYGQAFANLIHHDYPSHDYDDLMSAVDAAIARGFVDAQNLFVTGGSGGGVLTAWIVGRSDRFRAAATQKPVINWASLVLTTDVYTFMPKYWFGKPPWEDPDTYWKHSPLSLVGCVSTPTLVVVGDQDLRTPVSDSEQYYAALQLRRVPTALVKVPGASHGGLAARPSQSAAKASAILAWFDRYRAKSGIAVAGGSALSDAHPPTDTCSARRAGL